jgi:O-antigen/teichoic acid export membrane protein
VNLRRLSAHAKAAGGAWGTALFQFLAGVILVRSLPSAEVGTFFLGAAIATLVFGVLDLRIEEGLTQFLIRERNASEEARIRPALRYAVAIDIASGAVIFGLTVAGLVLFPLHFDHRTRVVAAIGAVASLVGVADGSFSGVLYACQAFGWVSAYQVLANAARCAALLVLPINSSTDAAWAIALAQVIATGFLVAAVTLRFLPQGVPSEPLAPHDRKWLLRFSIHVGVASAVATVRTTAIPIMIGAVGTKRQVAAARVAESPTRLLGIVVAPLRTVLFPRLSGAWARRDRADARRLIRGYIVTTLVLGSILGVAMALTIGFLLTRIYGSSYAHLGRVGQFFVLAAVLDALAGWQKVTPAALDRPSLRTLIVGGEAIALLLALIVLVPPFAALGAAISAAIAAATSLAMGAYWLRPAFAERRWRRPLCSDPGKGA